LKGTARQRALTKLSQTAENKKNSRLKHRPTKKKTAKSKSHINKKNNKKRRFTRGKEGCPRETPLVWRPPEKGGRKLNGGTMTKEKGKKSEKKTKQQCRLCMKNTTQRRYSRGIR